MARIKRFSPFLNLTNFQVFINDSNANSQYFRVNEVNEIFTGGKNGFLIEGTPFLRETTEVKIEILDVNGKPIYVEPGDGAPEYYEGLSKLVSVHVYDDTPIGVGKITILGELKEYVNGLGQTVPVPAEWVGAYNVKWERDILINRNLNNETIVRFFYRPQVTITEFEKPVFEKTIPIVTHTGSVVGIPENPTEGTDLSNWGAGTLYKLVRTEGPSFSSSMDENTISLPSINFSPRIIEVLNDDEVLVNLAYTDASNIVRPFTATGYTSSFEYGEVISESTTLGSFAKIDIKRLETFVGDVARVKIFRKSRNTTGDYTLVQESKLESTELLKDVTTTSNTETLYGFFNLDTLQSYWQSGSDTHPLSINYSVLSDSVKVDYDTVSGGVQTLTTIESYPLTKDIEYTLSFRTILSGSISTDKTLRAYVSSSTTTQDILTLVGSTDYITRETVSENVIIDTTADAKLVFEFIGDDWYISNVSFRAASDTSFSPDEFSIVQNVPRKLTAETFDFRFEFYDINNNYIPVDVFASKEFTAGNDFGGGTTRLLIFESTQNAFRFSSGSLASPPFQQIQLTTTANGTTGSVTYYSSAFDTSGNYIDPIEYMSQSVYEWSLTIPEYSQSGSERYYSASLVDTYFEGYDSTPSFIYGGLSGFYSGSLTSSLSDFSSGSIDGYFSGSIISPVTESLVFMLDAGYPNSFNSISNTWTDLSPNGYDAILSGSSRITYNEAGEYFEFNNPTELASTGFYITNLNYLTDASDKIENLTIDTFIRNNSESTNSNGEQRIILSFDKSSVFRFGIGTTVTSISASAEGKPFFGWTGALVDGGSGATSDKYAQDFTGDLRDDEWHHVCVTFSTSSLVFYVDGEPVTTLDGTYRPIGNQTTSETPRYGWIGVGSEAEFEGGSTIPSANFHGSLGVINMYYETFTHEQVLQNFNALRHRYGISAVSSSVGTTLIDTISGSYTGSVSQTIDSSSFTFPNYPGLLTNPSDNGATLLVSNFTGSLSSYTVGSILYTASVEDLVEYETIFRLEDGDNAPTLIVTSNANQFIYEPTALEPKPAGQTINIRAQRKNLASLITPITVNSSSLSGNPPPLTFVGTDTTRGVDTYSITALEYSASNADAAFPETTYQFSGSDVFGNVYFDEVTISPVINFDGISVVLSNETNAFRANSIGTVTSTEFDQGDGTVDVRIGGKIISHSEGLGGKNVFDIISASASTGLTANEENPTTNAYGISAMSVDSGSLDLLIRYEAGDGATTVDFTKKVTYTKARSATPNVVVTGNPLTQGITAQNGFTNVSTPSDITFTVSEAGTSYSYNSLGVSNPYEYVITSVTSGTNNGDGTITPTTPYLKTVPIIESVSSGTTGTTSSTTVTIASAPSGLTNGDLILIIGASEKTTPTAWGAISGYTQYSYSSLNTVQLCTYYKIADGTETFPLTITHSTANDFAVVWALRISGADTSDPVAIFGTSASSTTNLVVPSITTTDNNFVSILLYGTDRSDTSPDTTVPTGWTTGGDLESPTDNSGGVGSGWYYKNMTIAGATGDATLTFPLNGYTRVGIQLGIKSATPTPLLSGTTGSVTLSYIDSEGTTTTGYTQDFSISVGVDGRRSKTGVLNYQISSSTPPAAPTATLYSFSDNEFTGLTANWGLATPTFSGSNQSKYWNCVYDATEDTTGGGVATTSLGNLSFGFVSQSMGFAGLVTFSGSDAVTDGNGGILSFGENGETLIKGDTIVYGSISSNNYQAGTGGFSNEGMSINLLSGSISSSNFSINNTGDLKLSGSIYATAGYIGGWQIIDDPNARLMRDNTSSTSAGLSPSDYPFYAGQTYANRASAPFRVTPAGALTATSATITGNITVTNTEDFGGPTFNYSYSGNGSQTLDTGTWTKITESSTTIVEVRYANGMGFYGSPNTNSWNTRIVSNKPIRRSDGAILEWDFSTTGYLGSTPREMIGLSSTTTAASYRTLNYALYITDNDVFWRVNDGNVNADLNGVVEGNTYRLRLRLKTGGGALGELYKNGDYSQPISSYEWASNVESYSYGGTYSNGVDEYYYITNAFVSSGTVAVPYHKITHHQVSVGAPLSTGTVISGNTIKTGVITSNNWSTTAGSELDLDNGTIKLGGSSSPAFSVTSAGAVTATSGTIGGWTLGSTSLSNGNISIKTSPQAGFEIFDGSTLKVSVNENSAFSSSAALSSTGSYSSSGSFYYVGASVVSSTSAFNASPDYDVAVLQTGSAGVALGYISTTGANHSGFFGSQLMSVGQEIFVSDISSSLRDTYTSWAYVSSGTPTYFSSYHWIVFELYPNSSYYEHQLINRSILASGVVKYENGSYTNTIKSHGPSSYVSQQKIQHNYRFRHIIAINYFEGSSQTITARAFTPAVGFPLSVKYGNSKRLSELNTNGLQITNGLGNSFTVNTSGNASNYLSVKGNSKFEGNISVTGSLSIDSLDVNNLTVGTLGLKGKGLTIDGDLRATGDIYAYSASDKRLKDNLIPISDAIRKLNNLTGYEFDWNIKSLSQQGHDYGVVAQEVQEILPEIVGTRSNNYLGVKYEKIIPLLIQAIKEQQVQIDELKKLLNK